jgi:hypothetical protein
MRNPLLFAVIPAILAAGGAAGTPATSPRPKAAAPSGLTAKASPARAKTGAAPAKSDTEIQRKFAPGLPNRRSGSRKFQVHVQGGVATFEGKTNVIQHKGVATRLAKSPGAVAVANHIEISEAVNEKAAASLENGRRRA